MHLNDNAIYLQIKGLPLSGALTENNLLAFVYHEFLSNK